MIVFALVPLLGMLVQADSLGYLRNAKLTASVDTFDTFLSEPNGPRHRGAAHYVVRTVRPAQGARWEMIDTWYDSTGHETARQATRTAPRALWTELETVRADVDSASMLVTPGHVTAWVVPSGAPPRLFDGDTKGERYDEIVVNAAIARRHAPIGTVFHYPTSNLYGLAPLTAEIDSLRVTARDTLTWGARSLHVVMLQRANGSVMWVDEDTGLEVASRGNAGPRRWWWHIRRGVAMH